MSKRNKDGDDHLRKKRARLRFKRIVRVAVANYQWITDVEEQGITLNVKKNVAMLVRKKHKTGILTMAKIRARLVPYLHFVSIGANRVLVKEGDVPAGVYFVVSGEIQMSRSIMNMITRKIESKPEAFFGPGDWIGEVEVLESELRMNTYTAQNNCEILVLDDFDFNSQLKPHVKKVWSEKKKAITSLSYLKFMNDSQIISACKFGIIRQYNPLDTIYPEEKDSIHHVHFVLSGECVLLQCLHMKVSVVKGETQYELPEVVKLNADEDADDDGKPEPFDVRELLRSSSSLDELGHNKKKAKRKAEFAKIEQNCRLLNQKRLPVEEPVQHHHYRMKSVRRMTRMSLVDDEEVARFEEFEDYDDFYSDDDDLNTSQRDTIQSYHQRSSKSSKSSQVKSIEAESEGSEIFTVSSSPSTSVASSLTKSLKSQDNENYATHFIDIGSMTFGGLFGVGEKNDHRVVMARTTVQCLLIPRYWLMMEDQNPGHIWQRMRFYLDRCIPSRETLFQDFIKTRKWAQFKEDCVEEFVHSTTNPTKIEDIPVIIRIVESKSDSHHTA